MEAEVIIGERLTLFFLINCCYILDLVHLQRLELFFSYFNIIGLYFTPVLLLIMKEWEMN